MQEAPIGAGRCPCGEGVGASCEGRAGEIPGSKIGIALIWKHEDSGHALGRRAKLVLQRVDRLRRDKIVIQDHRRGHMRGKLLIASRRYGQYAGYGTYSAQKKYGRSYYEA